MEKTMGRKSFVTGAVLGAGSLLLAATPALAAEAEATGIDLAELKLQIERQASIEEIRNQLFNYMISMDRLDAELGYSVFAEESELDYGSDFQGTGREFVDFCMEGHAHCEWTNHMYGAMRIEVNATNDKAGSSVYGLVSLAMPADIAAAYIDVPEEYLGGSILQHQRARYSDQWEKRDGKWVIVRRKVSKDLCWIDQSIGFDRANSFRGDEMLQDPTYWALSYGMDE